MATSVGLYVRLEAKPGRDADVDGRAHLHGKVAAALMANASELLASEPRIDKIDVLADKLPG